MTAADINLVLSGVASVLAAGSWISTCILNKRNARKIEAAHATSLANGDRLDRMKSP